MMPPDMVDSDPRSFDTYLSGNVAARLWDGTPLNDITTPRHDLRERPRPFPQQRNFFYDRAVTESARWLKKKVRPEPSVYRRLLREDVGGFVSWTYPDATPGQLRALTDFHNWAVWLDDLMDRRSTLDISLKTCATLEAVGDRALAPFDDFFTRMRVLGMSDQHAGKFTHALRQYGTSSRAEVHAREGLSRFSSITDYIDNRRASAAMPVYYALIAWISRIDLPTETYHHPLVKRLETCCSDYAALYNDAGSFLKEHLAGRSDGTFVRLLSHHTGQSVQDTLYEIADMAAAAADDLDTTSDLIDRSDLPLPHKEQVHHYAAGLRTFTGGVNIWSNHTCRYLIGQPLTNTPATSHAGDRHHLRKNHTHHIPAPHSKP